MRLHFPMHTQIRQDLSWLKLIMAGPLYESFFIIFGGNMIETVLMLYWFKLPQLRCPEEMESLKHIACFNADCTLFSKEFMGECLRHTWMHGIDNGMPLATTSVLMKASTTAIEREALYHSGWKLYEKSTRS